MNFSKLILLSNYDKHTNLALDCLPKIHVQRLRSDVVLESLLSSVPIHTMAKGALSFSFIKDWWATGLVPNPLLQLHT